MDNWIFLASFRSARYIYISVLQRAQMGIHMLWDMIILEVCDMSIMQWHACICAHAFSTKAYVCVDSSGVINCWLVLTQPLVNYEKLPEKNSIMCQDGREQLPRFLLLMVWLLCICSPSCLIYCVCAAWMLVHVWECVCMQMGTWRSSLPSCNISGYLIAIASWGEPEYT